MEHEFSGGDDQSTSGAADAAPMRGVDQPAIAANLMTRLGAQTPRPVMRGISVVRWLFRAWERMIWRTSGVKRASVVEGNLLRAQLRASEQALADRARSVAMTSHELRTPLNGILGMSELLTRTPLSAEQASYVQAIETSAAALLSLVDDMLDAGKIEAGRWQPRPRPVALEALVEQIVELLAPRAQAKGLELAAHVGQQVPESVSVDPDQLARILMNLTGNAIKFTDRGGVAIEVAVESSFDAIVRLAISVRDSGIGIAPADQLRIFAEYEQADAGPTSRAPGTGLGLAISRAIAQTMEGSITVSSVRGEGATFCLRIDVPIVLARPVPARPLQGRHLLLLSDRVIEPPLLMRRLFDLGLSVELTRTVEAAISVLATGRRVDGILFDHAGALDAAEFLSRIGSHLPIAVMVAPADRHVVAPLRARGIRAHLVKPIRTRSLTNVLSVLLEGSILPGEMDDGPDVPAVVNQDDFRILLADDNEINILLGRSSLESLGYAVEIASDGGCALDRATQALADGRGYDLILMDLHMPVLDGFAAIESIRSVEAMQGHRALIVALTADSTQESSTRAIEAGADLTLMKPVGQHQLADLLSSLRARRQEAGATSIHAAGLLGQRHTGTEREVS